MKSVVIIAIAFVLLIPITAFAQTENITVKHWFISSYENGCSVVAVLGVLIVIQEIT